jgi:hypothetical protein
MIEEVDSLLTVARSAMQVVKWWPGRQLLNVVRAAQQAGGLFVLNRLNSRWVLQVGKREFPPDLLPQLLHRGLVKPDVMAPSPPNVQDLVYWRLTDLAEQFSR